MNLPTPIPRLRMKNRSEIIILLLASAIPSTATVKKQTDCNEWIWVDAAQPLSAKA